MLLGIFVFGKDTTGDQFLPVGEEMQEMTKADDEAPPPTLEAHFPINLGRFTRWILSDKKAHRLRGYAAIHVRFWHAKLEDMKTLLDRAGVDYDEEEIKEVLCGCKICSAWGRPSFQPRAKISCATRLGEEVFFDFFFLHDGEPIAHLIDEATSFSVTLYT